jgi:hypothetical protein
MDDRPQHHERHDGDRDADYRHQCTELVSESIFDDDSDKRHVSTDDLFIRLAGLDTRQGRLLAR